MEDTAEDGIWPGNEGLYPDPDGQHLEYKCTVNIPFQMFSVIDPVDPVRDSVHLAFVRESPVFTANPFGMKFQEENTRRCTTH